MTLIDLDRPDAEPEAQRAGARSRLALAALALVVAGGVTGGVAIDWPPTWTWSTPGRRRCGS
jgi:hypothetical protein